MMTNVMEKTRLNQKIIKNSNFIQAIKNSVCPKAKVIRRPNFSESRICPNIYRTFRSVDRTHAWQSWSDVKWHLFNFSESRICPNILRMFRSVNWTHDMIIVKSHLFIWHELIHLKRAQTFRSEKMRHRINSRKQVNDYQRHSMLTVLPLRSMSCTLGISSSL